MFFPLSTDSREALDAEALLRNDLPRWADREELTEGEDEEDTDEDEDVFPMALGADLLMY